MEFEEAAHHEVPDEGVVEERELLPLAERAPHDPHNQAPVVRLDRQRHVAIGAPTRPTRAPTMRVAIRAIRTLSTGTARARERERRRRQLQPAPPLHPVAPPPPPPPTANDNHDNDDDEELGAAHGGGGGGGGGERRGAAVVAGARGAGWAAPRRERRAFDDEDDEADEAELLRARATVLDAFERGGYFVVLLLVVTAYEHLFELLLAVLLTCTWYSLSLRLQQQESLGKNRELSVLVGIGALVATNVFGFSMLLFDREPWRFLLFLPPTHQVDMWEVVAVVLYNDFLVRFVVMFVKLGVLALLPLLSRQTKRFWFSLLHGTSAAYRSSIPIVPWQSYFLGRSHGLFVGPVVTAVYMVAKLGSVFDACQVVGAFLVQAFSGDTGYGMLVGEPELGDEPCPICHDEFARPVRLRCAHVFCDECVTEWLEREPTCPLCRSAVDIARIPSREHVPYLF